MFNLVAKMEKAPSLEFTWLMKLIVIQIQVIMSTMKKKTIVLGIVQFTQFNNFFPHATHVIHTHNVCPPLSFQGGNI